MFQCCIIFKSLDETELDGRLLVIARVPQVSMLNGSKVRFSFSILTFILKQVYQKERQNAEIHYIMKYFPDWIRAKKSGTERDFASNHIQYKRLSEGTVLCTEKYCSQKILAKISHTIEHKFFKGCKFLSAAIMILR